MGNIKDYPLDSELTGGEKLIGSDINGDTVNISVDQVKSYSIDGVVVETPASIKTKYESNSNTNAFTDAEKTKLGDMPNFLGIYTSLALLTSDNPSPSDGDYGYVDSGMLGSIETYVWDNDNSTFILQGSNFVVKYKEIPYTGSSTTFTTADLPDSLERYFGEAYLANIINTEYDSFTVEKGEIPIFALFCSSLDGDTVRYTINNGPGTYGVGGTSVLSSNIVILSETSFIGSSGTIRFQKDTTVYLSPQADNNYLEIIGNGLNLMKFDSDTNLNTAGAPLRYEGAALTQYTLNNDNLVPKSYVDNKVASAEKFLGTYLTLGALSSAYPSPQPGSYGFVDPGTGSNVVSYIWDDDDNTYVEQVGSSTSETPSSIKTKYESNADTNAFTDAEKTKLASDNSWSDALDSNILPDTHNTRNIGANANRIAGIWTNNIIANSGQISSFEVPNQLIIPVNTSYPTQQRNIGFNSATGKYAGGNAGSDGSIIFASEAYVDSVVGSGISDENQRRILNARYFKGVAVSTDRVVTTEDVVISVDPDEGKKPILKNTSSSNRVLEIPNGFGTTDRDTIIVEADGTGTLSVRPEDPTTVSMVGLGFAGSNNSFSCAQYERATIFKIDTNVWRVDGSYTPYTYALDPILGLAGLYGYYTQEGISESSGSIGDWTDSSGNGNDLILGVSPSVVTNATTGLKEARFDGTDDRFVLDESTPFTPTPNVDSFAFVIKNGETVPSATGYIYGRTGPSGSVDRPYGAYVTGSNDLRVYAGGTIINADNTFVPNAVIVVNHKGTTVDVWADGVKVVDAATSGTNNTPSTDFTVGSRGDEAANFLNFDLSMFAIINNELTDGEIADIFTEHQVN